MCDQPTKANRQAADAAAELLDRLERTAIRLVEHELQKLALAAD